ncbi:XrtB/PEP-CTERM-associated polysaccharide biosynthesis outer membrane protein EpsL [Rhodoferax sp.]|uniref:XrtB/PEP-CTERM-associated polysaccharide biosynthesis outer membrane protein EpsL n=1 Tax=Rhodoferax sp. TaxID=50421 RepID=UPI001ED58669|nr:XrtB/PEP-CTERM-associated polysaccharide biosynthesis outer membrane protein EpsL [Rhodoferax sp.]MBT9507761.1 putative exosortase B-associated extracellular polysaccharide biosynthesis transporter EpsL [Rhodoferax sp.]
MLVRRDSLLLTALLGTLGAAPAWAQAQDTLTLIASQSLSTDSNLFRLPAHANTMALIGKSSAAEQIESTSLTLKFSKAYSLQRFELAVNLIDYRYQNFNYLSFTAHNYNAAWRWSFTPRLHGNLNADRSETLNSFSDFQGFNLRNQRTNTSSRFNAIYELGGPWEVFGGVSRTTQTNLQPLLAESDYAANSAEAGLRFAQASGSSLAYTLKNASGQNINRAYSPAGLYDDGFKQVDHALKFLWAISGNSTADLTTAYINRTHAHFSQRDYSGLNSAVNLNWNISGKSALSAGWARDLSSYQTASTNYSQTDRLFIGPVWQLSPKMVARARYEVARREYLGSPSGLVAPQRSDTTTDASVSLDWQPNQYLTFSATLQNAKRASTLPGLDYDSHMATLSAQFTY